MNKEFLVPISIVFTLLGAAVSYGVAYNKIDNLEALVALEREDRKEDVEEIKNELATTNALLTKLLVENGMEISSIEDSTNSDSLWISTTLSSTE